MDDEKRSRRPPSSGRLMLWLLGGAAFFAIALLAYVLVERSPGAVTAPAAPVPGSEGAGR